MDYKNYRYFYLSFLVGVIRIKIVNRGIAPMSSRSLFILLGLSFGWFEFQYSMVLAEKWTRNGQTVFLLGACGVKNTQDLQKEWQQIDLVLRILQERVRTNNRPIRILYEKAPAKVKAACAIPLPDSNRERIDRFTVNFDDMIEKLQDPHFILQDMPIRIIERELVYVLWLKDNLDFEDKYFDERATKELRTMTLNDFIEDLGSQEKMRRDEIEHMPIQDKVRCIEQLEMASRKLNFFKREIARYQTDKPLVDFLANIPDESCAELYESIHSTSGRFFDAFIGHQIMQSNPNEDLIILVEPENASYQHLIGLGWKSVYIPQKEDYWTLLSEQDLEYVLCHQSFSEKILNQLQALASQTQQSVSSIYQFALRYLSRIKFSSDQAK